MEKLGAVMKSLRILQLLGLYNERGTRKIVVFTTLYGVFYAFLILIMLILFLNNNGDVSELIDNVVPFGASIQVLTKICVISWNRGKLIKILDDTKHFWKITSCPSDLQSELQALQAKTMSLQTFFVYGELITCLGIVFLSVITNSLPLGRWGLEATGVLYKLTFVCELFIIPISSLTATAFDTLFVAFNIEGGIQFRILRHYLRNLKIYNTRLKHCIEHHIFLLKFVESLQSYFSIALLAQYVSVSLLICGEMFMTFESGNNMPLLIRAATSLCCFVVQFALYCFAADFISSEAANVSDAIYDSNWYSTYDETSRKSIGLLIQRAQRRVFFSAAGLVDIQVSTLLAVLKVSWSTCNVFRAMKSDNS